MIPDMSAIAQAFSSINGINTITQGLISLRDVALISGKVAELNGKIIETQSAIGRIQDERSSLIERIRDLEKEVADLKAWDAEKQRYELKDVVPGSYVYVLKKDSQGSETPHWLCANCYNSGKKSLMQYFGAGLPGRDFQKAIWACHACKSQVKVAFQIKPSTEPTDFHAQL
jgi:cell division protein FtsB